MVDTVSALLLAVLLPTAPAEPEPRCRAELEGRKLTTTLAYPDGYSVEAPWRVVETGHASVDGVQALLVVDLALDRIIEQDGMTGQRTTTPLVRPILLTFEAPSQPELVHAAAQTWCRTVLRARGAAVGGSALPPPGRMT